MRDARLLPPSQGDRLRARDPVARRTHLHVQRRVPVPPRPPRQADQRMERETAPGRYPPVDNTIKQDLPQRTTRVPHLKDRQSGQPAQAITSSLALRLPAVRKGWVVNKSCVTAIPPDVHTCRSGPPATEAAVAATAVAKPGKRRRREGTRTAGPAGLGRGSGCGLRSVARR